MSTDVAAAARTALERGDARAALELVDGALGGAPGDARLLTVRAVASVDLDLDDAVERCRAAVAAAPQDAEAHRSLGLALLADGDLTDAADALRTAVRLNPDDVAATIALGHLVHRRGADDDATDMLEAVAERDPSNTSVVRNLVEMHRMAGRVRKAAHWVERLLAVHPDDPVALLDAGELHLDLGEHAEARATFERLRDAAPEPSRGIVALHGMIEAELRRGHLRAALDLAVTATGADPTPLTTDVLAYVVTQVFGPGERAAPSADELFAGLTAERRALRDELAEDAALETGDER